MNYCSIDIGTNTFRLLIAELTDEGAIEPLVYERRITRLGGGYTEGRGLHPEAAKRGLQALSEFARLIAEYNVTDVTTVATSVVRRAKNSKTWIKQVLKQTGIKVRVIDGFEEARLSLLGALSVVEPGCVAGGDASAATGKRRIIMDIGGGSTEFVAANGAVIESCQSMEMGVVHLCEEHLLNDPPLESELDAMEKEIDGVLKDVLGRMKAAGVDCEKYTSGQGAELVGTAGTVTTLAALELGLERYDRDYVNNYILTEGKVDAVYRTLSANTLQERGALLPLEKGREDLIIPGAAIVLCAMSSLGFNSLTVSDAGLLEGVIVDKFKGACNKQ